MRGSACTEAHALHARAGGTRDLGVWAGRYKTAKENETPYTIAKLLRIDIDTLMDANARKLPEMRKSSRLRKGPCACVSADAAAAWGVRL
jgi:hypothetical protein